jgi:hypothetical protein
MHTIYLYDFKEHFKASSQPTILEEVNAIMVAVEYVLIERVSM